MEKYERRCLITSNIDWDSPEIADKYDRNSDHQYQKGLALIAMMNVKKGDAVLDVGCGTGRQALNVSGIIGPSGVLTGIDPSSYRLEIAKNKFKDAAAANAYFIVGHGEDLSALANNTFDHAYFCSSFHWVDDKQTALRETYRVLKPGGNVGMTTLDRSNSFGKSLILGQVLEKYGYPAIRMENGMKRVTKNELEVLLADAGFKDIHIDMRIVKRYHKTLEDLFGFGKGLYGDRLKGVPEEQKREIAQDIMRELDKLKTPQGIEFETKTLFALAVKPTR